MISDNNDNNNDNDNDNNVEIKYDKEKEIEYLQFGKLKVSYMMFFYTRGEYRCFVHSNVASTKNTKIKEQTELYQRSPNYNAKYCFSKNEFVQMNIQQTQENGLKYNLNFLKNVIQKQKIEKEETTAKDYTVNKDGLIIINNKPIVLDFEKFDYIFGLNSARCGCKTDNPIGFEFEVTMET